MPDKINAEPHLPWLDGIRGLAILLVVSGHFFYQFYILAFGWIGLNLFFVLSGYLITNRLFVHLSASPLGYFKNFYGRRILRIFPLYYGCLAFFFIVLPLVYSGYAHHFGSLFSMQAWYWLYLSNWRIIWFGLPANPIFFHFWSLAVEEQFYLLWPVIFLLLPGYKKRMSIILMVVCASILVRFWSNGDKSAYYDTLTAAEPLLFGAMISILQKEGKLGQWYKYLRFLGGIAALVLVIILCSNSSPYPDHFLILLVGYSCVDICWACLISSIILNTSSSRISAKMLNSKMFMWLGIYSYGIYVFHWIILQLFVLRLEGWLNSNWQREWLSYWIPRLTGIALTLALSFISFEFYEKKFLRMKKYFT